MCCMCLGFSIAGSFVRQKALNFSQSSKGLRLSDEVKPVVLVLNFPRSNDVEFAAELGIREIVSKPFHLANLRFAIERAVSSSTVA